MTVSDDRVRRDEVVLITGASRGIGLACAEQLSAAGYVVVGASRDPASDDWIPLRMDVDDDDDVARGVTRVLDEHGHIDAVVTAAGWGLAGPVEHTPIADAKAQLETNFWGTVRVVNSVLPEMHRRGRGHVVLVSSIGGAIGLPFQAFYSASKFALEGYAEALAYEVRPFGISVTLVQPGNIHTDFTANRRKVADVGAYADAMAKAVGKMERDEVHGAPPGQVADTVARVLGAEHPRRRVSTGKLGERVGLVAKRVLPHAVFERVAARDLGL